MNLVNIALKKNKPIIKISESSNWPKEKKTNAMTDNKNLKNIQQYLNTPKTETKIILNDWQLEAKTSKLSPAARNKIVNSGSYISERSTDLVPSYGPCTSSNCTHTFYMKIKAGTGFRFTRDGMSVFPQFRSRFDEVSIHSYSYAQEVLSDLEDHRLYVCNWTGAFSSRAATFESNFQGILRDAIRRFEGGESINRPNIVLSNL